MSSIFQKPGKYSYLDSEIGLLKLRQVNGALCELSFLEHSVEQELFPLESKARNQLEEYFAGTRKKFTLDIEPEGTEFERKVWDIVSKIPFGKTTSYGDIAKKLGSANLSRAVGMANGKNPIPIVIPCHRVIGASGDLTGYSGGLWRKRKLLTLEGHQAQGDLFL